MTVNNEEQPIKWRINLNVLKWATILLPILFLAGLDWLRHTVFLNPLHTIPGFVTIYAVLAIGVVFFSYIIFGFIGRLQKKVVDQNQHLLALNDIAKLSAVKPGINDVLQSSLDTVLAVMKADSGLICQVDPEKEEHTAICYRGAPVEFVRKIQRADLKDDLVAYEAVKTGKLVIVERVLEDPRIPEEVKQRGIKSIISAPLKSEGEVNGILAIASRTERNYSDADREFLESIGGQLGLVVRNASRFEQSQTQNQELSALLSVGKVTTSSLDLDGLLDQSLDTIIGVTSADAAEIWLKDDNDEMVMRCHRGAHSETFLERTRFGLGEGIPGIVAQTGEDILVHDLPSDTRFRRQKVTEAGFNTFYAMPLIYQDKLVGVLAMAALSAEDLTEQREFSLLKGIGEWLALATENTRLYQQVQDIAVLQERERLAHEMHDGMAQMLGYVNTQTIAVKKLLADDRTKEARTQLTRMEEIARDLYADVREGILGLRIASRKDGLFPGLQEYTERFTDMSGIKVEIRISPEAEHSHLTPAVEIQLIRIIQESLTNVRKHSHAGSVNIEIGLDGDGLCALVVDDGQGFETTRLPSAGRPRFGLHTMRERAEAVGGSFILEAAAGKGTSVKVCVPVPQQND